MELVELVEGELEEVIEEEHKKELQHAKGKWWIFLLFLGLGLNYAI